MKLVAEIIFFACAISLGLTVFVFLWLYLTDKSYRRRPRERWNRALDNFDKWLEEHSK